MRIHIRVFRQIRAAYAEMLKAYTDAYAYTDADRDADTNGDTDTNRDTDSYRGAYRGTYGAAGADR